MDTARSFSASYQEARAKFRTAASVAGARLTAFTHPERGPDGGELACDVAVIGPESAERVLLVISGTHGVEGFFGSGAQVDWLRRGEHTRLPPGTTVILAHAINPYGFAWLRRVDHENIDLNRNWIDFSAPVPVNPGYEALHDACLPDSWSDAAAEALSAKFAAHASEHGPAATARALTGGQYAHADGLFYGGRRAAWSRAMLEAVYDANLGAAARIAILDYHTGLGPWGFGEQIVTEPKGHPAYTRAAAWFGVAATSMLDGGSSSAELSGDGLAAAPALLGHAEVTTMALEVGTLPSRAVRDALAADNWLHARGDLESPLARRIKAQIRDAFYGDADDWKGMAAGQALLACRQAIAGLNS